MSNTLDMGQHITPIETVEAFIQALKTVSAQNASLGANPIHIQESDKNDAEVINALKKRGFPNKDEYNLERIIAHDIMDLEIKFNLLSLPYVIAMLEHEDDDELVETLFDITLPITEICEPYLNTYKGPFPVTVTLK